MAVTVQLFNHTVKKVIAKEITFSTLKVMLLNNTAAFDATNTTLNQVAGAGPARAKEVFGNGWTQGGLTLANVTETQVTTNDGMIDADDASATAAGGAIGPAYAAVVYDDTDANDAPLAYIDFGGAQSAGDTTVFKISWAANGLIQFQY